MGREHERTSWRRTARSSPLACTRGALPRRTGHARCSCRRSRRPSQASSCGERACWTRLSRCAAWSSPRAPSTPSAEAPRAMRRVERATGGDCRRRRRNMRTRRSTRSGHTSELAANLLSCSRACAVYNYALSKEATEKICSMYAPPTFVFLLPISRMRRRSSALVPRLQERGARSRRPMVTPRPTR